MRELMRALEPLQRKLRMIAGRAVLSLMSDAFTCQVKGFADEVRDEAEVFQQYGFRSRPLAGAEGILLALAGNRDHTVILCLDDRRYTVTLKDGECAMFDHLGKYIILKDDGSIALKADTKVRMEVPLLEVTGEIKDKCDSGGFAMSVMRAKHDGHTHPENNAPGGSTNAPNQKFS